MPDSDGHHTSGPTEQAAQLDAEPRVLMHRHSIDSSILDFPAITLPTNYAMSSPPRYPIPPRTSSKRPGSSTSQSSQASQPSENSFEPQAAPKTPPRHDAEEISEQPQLSLPLRPKSAHAEEEEKKPEDEAAEIKLPASSDEEDADEEGEHDEEIKSVDATEIKLPSSDYDDSEPLEATDIRLPSSILEDDSIYPPKVKIQSPALSEVPEVDHTAPNPPSTHNADTASVQTDTQTEYDESNFKLRFHPSIESDEKRGFSKSRLHSLAPSIQSKPSSASFELPRTNSVSSIPSTRSFPSGHRGGLPLKEQTTTIDRLSKENWDLKLKITFLNAALNDRSDEAIKDMIAENVELKASLFSAQKEARNLRRTVKNLEQKLREQEDGGAQKARNENTGSDDEKDSRSYREVELEEEVTYYRTRMETYEREMERVRKEGIARENETRRLAEAVRTMGERRGIDSDIGVREEIDMWKDMYETEAARREQADEDSRRLREDLQALKNGRSSSSLTPTDDLQHKNKRLKTNGSRPGSRETEQTYDQRGGSSDASSSTLVEQLRHENAELRREVGAQTSMLTSRNRERERLYQEIEDLKYNQRRADGGRSVAGESIFDRSASRVHQRNFSRAGAATRMTQLSDPEKEELENKNDALRDQVLELRLKNQELERNLVALQNQFGLYENDKMMYEKEIGVLENDVTLYNQDLRVMQTERDEVLASLQVKEMEFQALKSEAQTAIDRLEEELDQRIVQMENLEVEIENKNEDFKSLQNEMRTLSESLVRLEDDQQSHARRAQSLEQELEGANQDIDSLEKSLSEANQKMERLLVHQESSEGEIAFLREEQDADKIKIGEMEGYLKSVQASLQLEQEKARQLDQKLVEEKHQREIVLAKERDEKQRVMAELTGELKSVKDEKRKLKKTIATREGELATWKQRLSELESDLRETLGDVNGTHASLIESITKLQKALLAASSELDITKSNLSEKERLLQNRDALLENTALETKKLSELLDSERQGRRQEKNQFEKTQRTHLQTMRTVSQQETRIMELENAKQQERRKAHTLEQQFKDQLHERNTLLLALFNRLSTLCGPDWAKQNCNINGRAPTFDAISSFFPTFSKTLIFAMKTVEGLLGAIKTRLRAIERDLLKDYQGLERDLQGRFKRLERIEGIVATRTVSNNTSSSTSPTSPTTLMSLSGPEIAKIRTENKRLRAELKSMKAQGQQPQSSLDHISPAPHLTRAATDGLASPTPPLRRTSLLSPAAALNRQLSASAAEHAFNAAANGGNSSSDSNSGSSGPTKKPNPSGRELSLSRQKHRTNSTSANIDAAPAPDVPSAPKDASTNNTAASSAENTTEKRWRERLREMERRLKDEREQRLLDRDGARKRLLEGHAQNEQLRGELERERVRRDEQ